MPEALHQRINVFNKQHGSKPPSDHKMREWNPQSIPAIHDNNNKTSEKKNVSWQTQKPKGTFRPFQNHDSKVKVGEKLKSPSISTLQIDDDEDNNDIQDIYTNDNDMNISNEDLESFIRAHSPSMSSFIADQSSIAAHIDLYDEEHKPTICTKTIQQYHQVQQANVIPKQPPSFQPFNFTTTHPIPSTVAETTPPALAKLLQDFHIQSNSTPVKSFLRQHALKLHALPTSSFRRYCSIRAQVDGGANVPALNREGKHLFYFLIKQETKVEEVSGSTFIAKGWGGVIVMFNNHQYLMSPVYYCPENPRHTFSPQSFIDYSTFNKSLVDTHISVDLFDHQNKHINLPIQVHNDLDFVTIDIAIFQYHKPSQQHNLPTINNLIMPTTTTVELVSAPSITPTRQPSTLIFPSNVMAKIAEYYVELSTKISPHETAIRNMNILLDNPYKSRILPQRPVKLRFDSTVNKKYPAPDPSDQIVIQPSISKLARTTKPSYSALQQWQKLHLAALHISPSVFIPMIRQGTLTDLPPSLLKGIEEWNCTCFICMLQKPHKLPKGKLEDKTNLPPFMRLHLDFHFYNIKSIRGFVSALAIVCASTSYPFNFPTKCRAPPLDIFKYLIRTIRSMGFQVVFIKVDEDGSLAQSSEFCKGIMEENCVLQTTGGGNSTSNGQVERANLFDAEMIRPGLATMKILMGHLLPEDMQIEMFWCFVLQLSTMTRRRLYNRMRGDSPYFLVHGKRPSAREFIVPGSLMTVVAPDKDKLPKLCDERATSAHFLGFGNNLRFHQYWEPAHPRSLKRSYHSIIEDTATFALLEKKVFALTTDTDDQKDNIVPPAEVAEAVDTSNNLELCSTGFPGKEIFAITMTLPPYPSPLGIKLCDDFLFNLPFIHSALRNSFIYNNIPSKFRRNHFIIAINGDCPLTSTYAATILKEIQRSPTCKVTLDLVHRGNADNTTSLSMTRAMFDQIPQLIPLKPVISTSEVAVPSSMPFDQPNYPIVSTLEIPSTHEHFVRAPSKPEKPKSFFDCLKGPHWRNWKAAAWLMFQKNKRIAVFSLPFPKSELPPGSTILNTLLVPEWKSTEIPGIYEPRIRECIIGTPQKQYVDFEQSYSPTVDPTTIKLQVCYTAANSNSIILIIDFKNAFQNTIAPPGKRSYVTVPPTYLEWLTKVEGLKFDRDEKYYRVMFNSNQGTKDAGNQWYTLLKSVLLEYGMIRTTVDHGFFVKQYEDKRMFLMSLATDDCLCTFPSAAHADDFIAFIQQYFEISIQKGAVLEFLGIRIIQTDHCISMDQSAYIMQALEKYFGKDIEKVRTVKTPMRYDNKYEQELFDAIPLNQTELKEYAIQYKGSFRYHTGTLGHAACQTRWDLKFPLQKLSENNNEPTSAAFAGIDHMYRYLAYDPHRPIIYPRKSFSGSSTLSYLVTPGHTAELHIPNVPVNFNDAELARCLNTRTSYYCTIILVLGVIIQMKVKKTERIYNDSYN